MSKAEGTTEQVEEDVVDLFAKDFDDGSLLDEDKDEGTDGAVADGSGVGVEDTDPAIPAKYEGKSLSDVIDMHQNLEKAYGRHNNELGELRQLTDQILKQQLGDTTSDDKEGIDQDDLLNDPTAAINRTVESNPRIKEVEARLDARERADKLAAFNRKHPEANKVVNDPRFLEWIQQSPTRVRLLQQADKAYDYDLASELITTYEDINGASGDSEQSGKEKRAAMKNASPNATAGKGGKKQYFKRADLMRLKQEDPSRYEKLQPQILSAYAEGRVR